MMIHDFEHGVMRCEECHHKARARGDLPPRRVWRIENVWRSNVAVRFLMDDEGGFCDDCGEGR